MRKNIYLITILLCLMISGCVTSFKSALNQSGINNLEGQTVYNRVSFRPIKGNKIWFTNLFHQGSLMPAGSRCIIKDISKNSITFIYDRSKGENKTYKLTDWLISSNEEDIKLSFHKFFVEDKNEVGLNKIRPEYYDAVISGIEEIGMNKEEILIGLGYPAYLGRKDPTNDDSRDFILEQNDWYYLKSKFNKYLLTFVKGKLYKTYD